MKKSGSATIAPAHATVELMDHLRGARQGTTPVSVMLDGEYGVSGVVLGVPAYLGQSGLVSAEEMRLTSDETSALHNAAEAIRTRLVKLMIIKHRAGGRFEEAGSYVRAKRVGPFVYVAGTTAIEPSGKLHAPGDTYAQTHYILKRIEDALREVGANMTHVMRTRAYLVDLASAGGFIRAHG